LYDNTQQKLQSEPAHVDITFARSARLLFAHFHDQPERLVAYFCGRLKPDPRFSLTRLTPQAACARLVDGLPHLQGAQQ